MAQETADVSVCFFALMSNNVKSAQWADHVNEKNAQWKNHLTKDNMYDGAEEGRVPRKPPERESAAHRARAGKGRAPRRKGHIASVGAGFRGPSGEVADSCDLDPPSCRAARLPRTSECGLLGDRDPADWPRRPPLNHIARIA